MELPLLGLPTKPLSRAKAVPEVAVEAAVPGTIPVVRDEMALVPEVAMEAVAISAPSLMVRDYSGRASYHGRAKMHA